MVDLMSKQNTVTLADNAPNWAKRRWQELVVERKTYTPMEMASRLTSCIGFRPEWIVTVKQEQSDQERQYG